MRGDVKKYMGNNTVTQEQGGKNNFINVTQYLLREKGLKN